jgi:hypothetical protein
VCALVAAAVVARAVRAPQEPVVPPSLHRRERRLASAAPPLRVQLLRAAE